MQTNIDKRIDRIANLVEKNTEQIANLIVRVDENTKSIKDLCLKVDENTKNIDDLAMIVKNGFDDVYEKFREIDGRLDKMVTIDMFNERMDRIEFRWNEHDRRIDNLEDKVGLISRKIGLSRK